MRSKPFLYNLIGITIPRTGYFKGRNQVAARVAMTTDTEKQVVLIVSTRIQQLSPLQLLQTVGRKYRRIFDYLKQ
jgi:hypothetical protein